MHDLDRIQLGTDEYEYDGLDGDHRKETGGSQPPVVGPDSRELQLASELLEVGSEHELDQFLGDLISSAAGSVGRFVDSPTGHALGGILEDVARKALPAVGQAIGDYVSPGSGGDWGHRAGAAAGQLFGLELEGLSNEDKEFELARRYVQLARSATRAAAGATGLRASPHTVARAAAAQAARRYAPGLLSLVDPASFGQAASFTSAGAHSPLTGRWVRRGRNVVVHL
jgi:hypothetical protein